MTARTSLLLLTLLPLVACGGGDDDNDGDDQTTDDGGEEGPVYVMMTQVYTTDDRIIYFSTSDTLDIDGVSFADSTEAPGVANFTALGGKLYISSGEQPKITQYDVLPDRSLEPTGEISFGAYPLGDNANFYYHYIVDENLVYLPYETSKRVAWSPSEMTILSDETTSEIPLTDGGLALNSGGNRTGVKYPSGPVAQPFFYTNDTWEEFGPDSPIATYDTSSHDEAIVESVPCPGLTLTTRAEDGTTYFSTDAYSPMKALFGVAAEPCVAVMSPSGEIETDALTSMTGGRYTMNFRYLRDGLAIGHVLDHESLGLDFSQEYDPAVEEQSYEAYELWMFDLVAGTARPVEGLDLPDLPTQHAVIDDRMFIFTVYDQYGMTRVSELSADGVAMPKFDVAGDVFKWERLR
jgi:hypothetical protein